MISNLVGILFSLFFAISVLTINTVNQNPLKLTIRGKRVLFAIAILGGLLLYQFAIHFFWYCNESGCIIEWK